MCENLQEENKRLRQENQNTLKINVYLDGIVYSIDTQIVDEWNFETSKKYYLADNYQNPTAVHFIDWGVFESVNKVVLQCACHNLENGKIEYYNPKELFQTSNQAKEEYLNKRIEKEKERL